MRKPLTRLVFGLCAWLVLCASGNAQTSYQFKDGNGTLQTVTSFNCSATICSAFAPIDAAGNALATTTGSAVPTSALYMGVNVGGNLTGWDKSVTQSGTWTVQPGNTANTTPWLVNQANGPWTVAQVPNAVWNIQGAPFMRPVVVTATTPLPVTPSATNDPCTTLAKKSVPISQTANALLFSNIPGKKNYVCSILAVGADAENISLVEGTGSTCGSNTAAIIGAATAAAGPNLAANGGFTLGAGGYTVASGTNAGFDVCLFQSGSGRVAGVLTYVQN